MPGRAESEGEGEKQGFLLSLLTREEKGATWTKLLSLQIFPRNMNVDETGLLSTGGWIWKAEAADSPCLIYGVPVKGGDPWLSILCELSPAA